MHDKIIGAGAYWTGLAVAHPSGQELLLDIPFFCFQIDFLPFHTEHFYVISANIAVS